MQLINVAVVGGTAFARSGANVRMSAGSNVLQGAGNFQIESRFQWFAGTMQGAGTTHVAAGSRLELYPESPSAGIGTRTLSRPLTNAGTVDYQDGPVTITSGGQFANNAGWLFLVSDGSVALVQRCAGSLTNAGTIHKDAALAPPFSTCRSRPAVRSTPSTASSGSPRTRRPVPAPCASTSAARRRDWVHARRGERRRESGRHARHRH